MVRRMLREVRFWHLMVGTGFTLVIIGLVLIFLPPEVGESGPIVIEFFEARFEGSEMGLALIVLGLSCFLIGRKDLGDLRTHQAMQEELGRASGLTAKLVAERVEQTLNGRPEKAARLAAQPEVDLSQTRRELRQLRGTAAGELPSREALRQAERAMALLEALQADQQTS